jgi:hypothetical protein
MGHPREVFQAVSYSQFLAPLAGFAVVGIFVLILRWAFSRGHSVVAAPSKSGHEDEYGLLRAIASPSNFIEGEILRRTLMDQGIRATLTTTLDGPRLLVFPKDERAARRILTTSK